jgi:putative tryptophan/tyrosine transport system substrate-binding protein
MLISAAMMIAPNVARTMRRRDFIRLVGGPPAVWLFAAHAAGRPLIGFLGPSSSAAFAPYVGAFHQGLRGGGFIEGETIDVEYRWADDQLDRLPGLAADLVSHPIQALVTAGATAAALAAKGATSTIPVVFSLGSDPVKFGLVSSMNRPGGNVTGVSFLSNSLVPKPLELLEELVPAARVVGLLANPANPNAESDIAEARAAAKTLRRRLHVTEIHSEDELDQTFENLHAAHADALLVLPDPLFIRARKHLATLAVNWKLPAIYSNSLYAQDGGLLSYGANVADAHRQVGLYVARILKGTKPADLPVFQSTKLELVINLKGAKEINLDVPAALISRSDEVIE